MTKPQSPTPNPYLIFNRRHLRLRRDRAAKGWAEHAFLFREMAERIAGRLADVIQDFPVALDLGAHIGEVGRALAGRGGVKMLVQAEMSLPLLRQAKGLRVASDVEFLPFADNAFDLVISAGALHWVNDLPGTLIQIRRALKPGGLFIGVMPGGETLNELRACLEQAEMELYHGLSARVAPYVDVRSAGQLLQRAGFSEPVADSETLDVRYDYPLKLMHDLRAMGETASLIKGSRFFPRALLSRAFEHYRANFSDDDDRVKATFELVTMTGWKPV